MKPGPLRRAKERITTIAKAMSRHPAFPLMGRVLAYWLLIVLILVFVVATRDTPIRNFTLFPGAIVVSVLMWKIRRRLNDAQQMLRAGQVKPKGLFARMAATIRGAKGNF